MFIIVQAGVTEAEFSLDDCKKPGTQMRIQIITEYGAKSTNELSFWLHAAPIDLVVENLLVTWNRAPDQWGSNNDYAIANAKYNLSVTNSSHTVIEVSDLVDTTYLLTLSDIALNVEYNVNIVTTSIGNFNSIVSTIKFKYTKIDDAKLDLIQYNTTSIKFTGSQPFGFDDTVSFDYYINYKDDGLNEVNPTNPNLQSNKGSFSIDFNISSLDAGKTYTFKVESRLSPNDERFYSDEILFFKPAAPPAIPT